MKNKLFTMTRMVIAMFLASSIYVEGGVNTTTRNKCKWYAHRYAASAKIKDYGVVLHYSQSGDCDCASTSYLTGPCGSYATASNPNGCYGTYILRYGGYCWHSSAGDGYTPPSQAPNDSIGFSQGNINCNMEFDSINHQIKLNNFMGSLSCASGTNYGSTLLIVVWLPDNGIDTIITPNKILYKGKGSIENGQFISSGFILPTDFNTNNVIDTFNAVPRNNLAYILPINANVILDSVAVSLFLEGGYGNFNEAQVLNTQIVNVPTLPQWGLIILSMAVITIGVWYIRRRRLA